MDMERYGDYNDIDEPKKKSAVGLIIKIIAAVLCITVVGTLAFRIITFNYYPESMKRLYFDDTLTDYYRDTDGNRPSFLAEDAGNSKALNVVLVGYLSTLGIFSEETLLESLKACVPEKLLSVNLKAFELGKNATPLQF